MSPSEILAEYAGALVTADVINREDLLEEIRQALHGEGTRVFYIRGAGGIGKTCLLRAVLRRCQPGGPWHRDGLIAPSPEGFVDLYHTVHHTREGLAYALRRSIPAPEEGFAGFDEAWSKWEREKYHLAGMLKGLSTPQEVGRAFVEDLNALAEKGYRPVLVLDTAERLLYREDEIQRRLGLEPERTEALKWLLEILPRLENAVVLIAGRPEPALLKSDLERALGDRLEVRKLGPFGLEETKWYFDAVAERAQELGWGEQANQIREISEDTREVIYHYTGGRPILLALMIDYLLVADALFPRVKESLEEVRRRSPEEREAIQHEVERELVRFWMETGREADQAIQALAWARKGMTPDLMARLLETDAETAAKWLESISWLSFVKMRPADERWFLHDEMYELLERHVFPTLPEAYRKRTYQAILEWYGKRIRSERERVRELWTPLTAQPEELARATDHLYNLMAEEVHYRLLRDSRDGFQTYQLYAKEAFWASEESLDHLLRSELLWFLNHHAGQEIFDGLHRREMEVDLALRRLEGYNRARYRQARDYARGIRQKCADLLSAAGPLAQIQLDVLEGETLLYLGEELPRAESLLLAAAQALESFAPASPFEEWRRRTLLAEAYNDLGYLYRTLGWFQKATEWYGKAVALWRQLEDEEADALRRIALRAQHANTLNNQAWALAELGHFDRAIRMAEDALEMRQALGPAAPVAFSLNTMGMIETRADQPHRARVHCSRALSIFRSLQQPRGVGLAEIALAEALRRLAAIPNLYAPEEGANLVREARGYLDDAVAIFSPEGPVPERPRLVEALIERGCMYRLWAWLRRTYPEATAGDPDLEDLVRCSEEDFGQAMKEAGKVLPYRYLDALVNRAWLYYYVRDEKRAEEEAGEALGRIPKEYHLPLQADAGELPHTFYWLLAGKTYLLLGQLAMRRFAGAKEEKKGAEELTAHLQQAGKYFTVALAYDELFAYEFRDIRRAIRTIYERLRGLNRQEMKAIHQGIADAIQKYGLRTPTRMDRVLFNHNLPVREGVTFEDRGSPVPAG